MSSPDTPNEKKKLPVAKLALGAAVLLVAAALVLRGVDVRALIDRGMGLVREAGPVVFFSAMMILPALGAPMLAFAIPAGEAFGERLGLGNVIAIALGVLLLNLALAYWIARYALRPALTKLVQRFGHTIPRVTPDNVLNVTLLVRLTPGVPYALQCFILGLAEVPFRFYLVVSFLAQVPWVVGAIVLGQGLFKGNFKVAASGIGLLVIAVIGVQWVRRRYFRRAG